MTGLDDLLKLPKKDTLYCSEGGSAYVRNEPVEEREARLQHDRESHRERRSTETADETEARLQRDRDRYREQRALGALSLSQLPLIQQLSVQAKIEKFHMHLATLEVTRCSTCSEAFPGLHLHPGSTECARCGRDKHVYTQIVLQWQ